MVCAEKVKTHLDDLVPTSRDNDGDHGVGGEADAGDPLGVAIVGDVELALAEGVPELDGAVTRSRDDLTVVGGERDAEILARLRGCLYSLDVERCGNNLDGDGNYG